jgi:hypothetical protein
MRWDDNEMRVYNNLKGLRRGPFESKLVRLNRAFAWILTKSRPHQREH